MLRRPLQDLLHQFSCLGVVLLSHRDHGVEVGQARIGTELRARRRDLRLRFVPLALGDQQRDQLEARVGVARVGHERGLERSQRARAIAGRHPECALQRQGLRGLRMRRCETVEPARGPRDVALKSQQADLPQFRAQTSRVGSKSRRIRAAGLVELARPEVRVAYPGTKFGLGCRRIEPDTGKLVDHLVRAILVQHRPRQQWQDRGRRLLVLERLAELLFCTRRVAHDQGRFPEEQAGLAVLRLRLDGVLEFDDGRSVVALRLVSPSGFHQPLRTAVPTSGETERRDQRDHPYASNSREVHSNRFHSAPSRWSGFLMPKRFSRS